MKSLTTLLTLLFLLTITATLRADGVTFLPTTGQGNGRDINYYVSPPQEKNGGTIISSMYSAYIATTIDEKWAKDAKWITPTSNPLADLPAGRYTFSTTFTLNGALTITGSLYCDDRVEVWINGKFIVELPKEGESGYWSSTLSTFLIPREFIKDGDNLLEFVVINTHNSSPVGLAVKELRAEVPEPLSLLLVGSGFLMMARKLRKRNGR